MKTFSALIGLAVVSAVLAGDASEHEQDEYHGPVCGYGCMHNATCHTYDGEDYFCQCPEGLTGRFCETVIPDCTLTGCENGGQCKYAYGEYYCECVGDYTGYACETMMLCGDDSHCMGGQCMENYCNCPPGQTGYHCETEIPKCESCHPTGEECMEAPCPCQGECQDHHDDEDDDDEHDDDDKEEEGMGTCYECTGQLGSACDLMPWGREAVTCEHFMGCMTKTMMHDNVMHIARGCAEDMCWNKCNDWGECTNCCMEHNCNWMPAASLMVVGGAASIAPMMMVTIVMSMIALLW